MAEESRYDEEIDYSAEINDYEDIEYDSDVEAPEEELHEFSQFENHEVDPSLFEGIDFNENIFQGFDEPSSDLEIVPLTVKFVSDESIKQVKESDQSTEQDSSKTVYICPKCSKKYTRHYHFENHVNKLCTAGKSASKSGLGSGLDDQSQNKGFLKTTLDNLKHLDITNEVLTSIKDDPINNLKVGDKLSPGNLVANFAAKLLQSKQSNAKNFEAASEDLVTQIYDIMGTLGNPDKNSDMLRFYRKIHLFALEKESFCLWKRLTLEQEEQVFMSLMHSLTMGIITKIVEQENKLLASTDVPASQEDLKMTNDEQKVVAYVGGYVIASLRKKYYRLLKSPKAETRDAASAALKLLNSLKFKGTEAISSNSFLEFTRKWTEIQNRGGLVIINDNTFIFIRRVENVARTILNTKFLRRYHNEDLRELLRDRIEKSRLVTLAWNELTSKLRNDSLKNVLRKQIIDKWIDIRINAYVRAYVQIYKRKATMGNDAESISLGPEPSIRKTLYQHQ